MKSFSLTMLTIFVTAGLSGCSNQYDECIQKQQEEYRASHPNAPYSEATRQRASFEAMCSSYKNK